MLSFWAGLIYVVIALFVLAVLPFRVTRALVQVLLEVTEFTVSVGPVKASVLPFAGWAFMGAAFASFVSWHARYVAHTVGRQTVPRDLAMKTQGLLTKWLHERGTYEYAILAVALLSLHVLVTSRRRVNAASRRRVKSD
jgi:hypothetical protein